MRLKWVIALVTLAGVLVLAAGSWLAWRQGLIPSDWIEPPPSAPVPGNFLAALRADRTVAARIEPPCLPLPMHTEVEDRRGWPGLTYAPVAGFASVGLLRGEAGALPRHSAVFELLARNGLVTATDGPVDAGSRGELPGRTYTLSFDGWNRLDADGCLRVGAPSIVEVSQRHTTVARGEGGHTVEVRAKVAYDQRPAWLGDPAFAAPEYASRRDALRSPPDLVVRLRGTDDGWTVEPDPARVAPPLPAQVEAMVARAGGAASRACILLPSAGDGVSIEAQPLAVAFDHAAARAAGETRRAALMMWRGRMTELARAGAFVESRVPADPASGRGAATRYEIDPELQRWYDPAHPSCLAMGAGRLELLGVGLSRTPSDDVGRTRPPAAGARFAWRPDPQAWVLTRELALPEVRLVRAIGGMPVVARLQWDKAAGAWALSALAAQSIALEEPRVVAEPARVDEPPVPQGASVPIQLDPPVRAGARERR
jgi:hypothetical protein